MCADSSNNTKADRNRQKRRERKSNDKFMCHLSPVTCHLAPVTIANTHSQRPYPLLTPPLCKVGWFAKTKQKKTKKLQNCQKPKTSRGMPVLAIYSKSNNLWLIDNYARWD